jgi:hypothetical protein
MAPSLAPARPKISQNKALAAHPPLCPQPNTPAPQHSQHRSPHTPTPQPAAMVSVPSLHPGLLAACYPWHPTKYKGNIANMQSGWRPCPGTARGEWAQAGWAASLCRPARWKCAAARKVAVSADGMKKRTPGSLAIVKKAGAAWRWPRPLFAVAARDSGCKVRYAVRTSRAAVTGCFTPTSPRTAAPRPLFLAPLFA